jgi:hypothetical protein
VTQWSEDSEFPYSATSEAMRSANDDDTRRDILRSGLRAWRDRRTGSAWHSLHSLLQLLRPHWRLLPDDEARDAIRSLVGLMRELPDEQLTGSFGGLGGTVTFSSYRPALLFALVGPLKRLDPELADAVVGENPELRRAAEVYPFGHDTDFNRPVEQPPAEDLEQWKRDWTGFALCASSASKMRRTVTSGTHSTTRFVRTHATRTRRNPIGTHTSAGRQLKTFE